MLENTIIYKNKTIYYKTAGSGKIVLLIHGFGETSDIWDRTALELSNRFKVIIPDLPGSGKSEMLIDPAYGKQIQMEDYAAVMKALIDHEITLTENTPEHKVSIVGHSFGGYIALEIIFQFPEIAEKICLFHSSAYPDDEQKLQMRKKAIDFIKKNGSASFLRSSIPELFSEDSKSMFKDEIESLKKKSGIFSKHALFQYYNVMMLRKNHINLLKETQLPVCFIIGDQDKAVSIEISLKQCHLPSISFITILKNVGHMGMIEDFNKSLNNLYAFLLSP